jgi:hypothetical protein
VSGWTVVGVVAEKQRMAIRERSLSGGNIYASRGKPLMARAVFFFWLYRLYSLFISFIHIIEHMLLSAVVDIAASTVKHAWLLLRLPIVPQRVS